MNPLEYTRFLEEAIRNQQLTQRIHIALAIGVVVLGLLGVTIAQVYAGELIPAEQKWLLTIGGGFISTLSSFPIKQIADRRIKISALEFLMNSFQGMSQKDAASIGEEDNRLIERFWKLMDTSLEN